MFTFLNEFLSFRLKNDTIRRLICIKYYFVIKNVNILVRIICRSPKILLIRIIFRRIIYSNIVLSVIFIMALSRQLTLTAHGIDIIL